MKTGEFTIKDSGQRDQFTSGMQRDTQVDKVLYSLVYDGPMMERWAIHLTMGAKKYSARNWMKARTEEEFERSKESFLRHVHAFIRGDRDEDHAAAIMFNVNLMEYIRERLGRDGADPVSQVQP